MAVSYTHLDVYKRQAHDAAGTGAALRRLGQVAAVIPILYEDNHLLVVVKPPHIPVQADASGDADLLTLLKADIKERYHKPGAVYLGLVHRLDRPVGGVMVFARTSKAAARLSAAIREGRMEKRYLCVACGECPGGMLTDWLKKDGRTHTSRVDVYKRQV